MALYPVIGFPVTLFSCALTYLAEQMGMTESPVSQREQRNQEEFGGEVDQWNFN